MDITIRNKTPVQTIIYQQYGNQTNHVVYTSNHKTTRSSILSSIQTESKICETQTPSKNEVYSDIGVILNKIDNIFKDSTSDTLSLNEYKLFTELQTYWRNARIHNDIENNINYDEGGYRHMLEIQAEQDAYNEAYYNAHREEFNI